MFTFCFYKAIWGCLDGRYIFFLWFGIYGLDLDTRNKLSVFV